jgi:hypothetical protein
LVQGDHHLHDVIITVVIVAHHRDDPARTTK